MTKRRALTPLLLALTILLMAAPTGAYAYSALQCSGGQPVTGTSLFDTGPAGACKFAGIKYIFSTILCQFMEMINVIMGRLYCSIQAALQPIVILACTVFFAIYGVQMLMGTAQLNASEVITRVIKMTIVLWLATDPTFGVSAGISLMFNFFISFITESTHWVVKVLSEGTNIPIVDENNYNPGITNTFFFIDTWMFNALTGSMSNANAKVIGFFVAMSAAMPSLFFMALYWWVSVAKMLINTLLAFLMAVVSVSFLLGLSPIFITFMLFKATFSYFDQWLRFMISYSLQVMVSFAILTLWLFSLTLFADFFNQLADVIYPYQKVIRPAAAIYSPADTWGICPVVVGPGPSGHPSVRCADGGFNPIPPSSFNSGGNRDYQKLIPPTKVPEMNNFLFFLFYHLISLIIISYGFASLQKNSASLARQLGGPSFTPLLNHTGMSSSFENFQSGEGEANRFMNKKMFSGFQNRHEGGETPYERMVHGMRGLVSGR